MNSFVRLFAPLAASLLATCTSPPPSPSTVPPRGELSFAVVANTAVPLHHAGQPPAPPQGEIGRRIFDWLAEALHERQVFPELHIDAPPPAFLFHCGNLTSAGAVEATWPAAEQLLDNLGLPWFAVAGEYDLQIAPPFEGFDARFGGMLYSFDRGGAHFIALSSATPCSTPGFSPLQLSWLSEDLARNDDRKPVFVFVHHAPDALGPQLLDLQAALDGHDIAAVFCGRRDIESRRVGELDVVSCGSTFMSTFPPGRDTCGYVHASIAEGRLRVVFRYFDPAHEPLLLLEKTLRYRPRAPLTIEEPQAGAPARGASLSIKVRAPDGIAPLTLRLDWNSKPLDWRRSEGAWHAELPIDGLTGGAHQLAIGCFDEDGAARVATRVFIARDERVEMRWRRNFQGSLRASPVRACDRLAVASTAGEVCELDPDSGELLWSAQTAAILGTPLGCDDGGVVTGNIEGWIEAYGRDGERRWRFQAGKPVVMDLAGDGESVFAVDSSSRIHALDLSTGERRWTRELDRGFVIERPSLRAGGLTVKTSAGSELTLDGRTGRVLTTADNSPFGLPKAVEGRIAAVGESGRVELLDAASGALLWTWQASPHGRDISATPLLGPDGTVWIAAMDGSLSCVRAR